MVGSGNQREAGRAVDGKQSIANVPHAPAVRTGVDDLVRAIASLCDQVEALVRDHERPAAVACELAALVDELRMLDLPLASEEQAVVERARRLVDLPSSREARCVAAHVQQTVEDVDRNASGSTLLTDAHANLNAAELLRWARALHAMPREPGGNYLEEWYRQLYLADSTQALAIGRTITELGVVLASWQEP